MAVTNIPSSELTGRSILRTDLTEFTAENIKKDLERVLPQHAYNRQQIRALQEYHRGWHPAIQARVKTTRTDVDNKVTVNYAWSATRDIVGYFLGKPIQYSHRKGSYRVQMEKLNSAVRAENKALVDYQIAEDCSICGIGYRGQFHDARALNGTHLKLMRLDPMDTFVVYPSNIVEPAAYAVTSYETTEEVGRTVYYTVYTPNRMFRFKDSVLNGQDPVAGAALELVSESNISFGGGLPITEYQNNLWRMGDWETAISLMDAIDAVASDGVNDIQQAVNSVLVAMGMELSSDEFAKLSSNGFLNVANIPAGVKPVVEFISQAMNADVGVAMRDYLEATLRVVIGVPDRKTRGGGGGDTGDAVFMRDGWQDIDLVAASKEQYFIQAERDALAVMLYILNTNNEVTDSLKPQDINIHFNRNKTANIQSKAQVYQTLTSGEAPLDPSDALDIADLTNNVPDVILRMEKYRQNMQKESTSGDEISNGDSDSDEDDEPAAGDDSGQ